MHSCNLNQGDKIREWLHQGWEVANWKNGSSWLAVELKHGLFPSKVLYFEGNDYELFEEREFSDICASAQLGSVGANRASSQRRAAYAYSS